MAKIPDHSKKVCIEGPTCRISDYVLILEMQLSNSVSDEISVSYLASGIKPGTPNPEEDEKIEIRKVHFDEVVEMVRRGEIKDALSVATILKVKLMRG